MNLTFIMQEKYISFVALPFLKYAVFASFDELNVI